MINGQRKYKITSRKREKFQAKSKKGCHAIKKTEETETTISKQRKLMWEHSEGLF